MKNVCRRSRWLRGHDDDYADTTMTTPTSTANFEGFYSNWLYRINQSKLSTGTWVQYVYIQYGSQYSTGNWITSRKRKSSRNCFGLFIRWLSPGAHIFWPDLWMFRRDSDSRPDAGSPGVVEIHHQGQVGNRADRHLQIFYIQTIVTTKK